MQFGQGALHRLAHSTVLDGETMTSARLARHKVRAVRRLHKLGLPAPRQILVHSVEEAVSAAERSGFSVVVKPLRGSGGAGVSVGVAGAEMMANAAQRALDAGGPILVEEMVSGTTFRLLVIGGKFLCALRLDQPRVTGGGRHSVRELAAQENADPMRDGIRLEPIQLDEQCVARQGYTLHDVPSAGQVVVVCGAANIGSGSAHTDVTDQVHSEHGKLAERAAAALGLLTAGVDVVSRDIAMSPCAARTHILEVNARPGLIEHMFPFRGTPHAAADRVLDIMFPPPATGRIPTVLVLGGRGGLATADAIAAELHLREVVVGVAARQRCSIGGVRLDEDDITLHDGIARMWRDPEVGALVVALDPCRALTKGLVIEAADVLCLLGRDATDDEDDYVRAVRLAATVSRAIVARGGDEGVAAALARRRVLGRPGRRGPVRTRPPARQRGDARAGSTGQRQSAAPAWHGAGTKASPRPWSRPCKAAALRGTPSTGCPKRRAARSLWPPSLKGCRREAGGCAPPLSRLTSCLAALP